MSTLLIQNKTIFYACDKTIRRPIVKFFIDIPEDEVENYYAKLVIGGSTVALTSFFTKVQFDTTSCVLPEEYLNNQTLYQIDFFENNSVIRGDECCYHEIQIFTGTSQLNIDHKENIYYCQLAKESEIRKSNHICAYNNSISQCQTVSFVETVENETVENEIDENETDENEIDENEIMNDNFQVGLNVRYLTELKNIEIDATKDLDFYTNCSINEYDRHTYVYSLKETLITYKDRNINNIIDKIFLYRRGYYNCDNVIRYMDGMAGLAFSN